jgi:excinuclease ABC subunit C
LAGDKGFCDKPDLLLIDGGVTHAATALDALGALGLDMPVFGMVKDDRHRTRALVTADGMQIRIDAQQAVFSLIGTIQEEVHRFAISYHRQKRSKRLRYSELDKIAGIGPKRKELLLKHFRSIAGIRQASIDELQRLLPQDAANAVYQYFQNKG